MRRLHLVVGCAGVVAFLLTGQYMDRWLDHLAGMPDLPRMLYRSGHIYLLLASLLNLALGLYLSEPDPGWRRLVQRVGSVLVVVAPILFLVGFTQEAARTDFERPWAGPAIYGIFGGVLLMAIASSGRRRGSDVP
jgi:hypothetical protein